MRLSLICIFPYMDRIIFVFSRIIRTESYTEKYGSEETRIFAYFTQYLNVKHTFFTSCLKMIKMAKSVK